MTEPLTITIPMTPSADLSPNARVHWSRRYAAAQTAKDTAHWAGRTTDCAPWVFRKNLPIPLCWLVAWEKGHKRMDEDNLIAALKPFQDGIAAFLGIDDKRFTTLVVTQTRDPAGKGYTVVTIDQDLITPVE